MAIINDVSPPHTDGGLPSAAESPFADGTQRENTMIESLLPRGQEDIQPNDTAIENALRIAGKVRWVTFTEGNAYKLNPGNVMAGAEDSVIHRIIKFLKTLKTHPDSVKDRIVIGSPISPTPLSWPQGENAEALMRDFCIWGLTEEEMLIRLREIGEFLTDLEHIYVAFTRRIMQGTIQDKASVIPEDFRVYRQQGSQCVPEVVYNAIALARRYVGVGENITRELVIQSIPPEDSSGFRNIARAMPFLERFGLEVRDNYLWEDVLTAFENKTGVLAIRINGNHLVLVAGYEYEIETNTAYFLVVDSLSGEVRKEEALRFLEKAKEDTLRNPGDSLTYRVGTFLISWEMLKAIEISSGNSTSQGELETQIKILPQ